MSKPIYIVGGSKGGVWKSMVSMALTNYLRGRNENVVLIETDTLTRTLRNATRAS